MKPASVAILVLLGSFGDAASRADPPLCRVEVPKYSFDTESPSIAPGGLSPAAVLRPGDDAPDEHFDAQNLGFLGTNGDDLDALSAANHDVSSNAFALLFSVDRASVGSSGPDCALVAAGVPYNVHDQAVRAHQAASDLFMSTARFTRAGAENPRILPNHVLVINHYNEGGKKCPPPCPESFEAAPPSGARDVVAPDTPQDNVDAVAYVPVGEGRPLYFSARSGSPSLGAADGLPGFSAADIFVDFEPTGGSPTQPTTIFASAADLGLQEADDIDAVIVFDVNTNGVFDGGFNATDQVLFSLTPDSPSLLLIPDANTNGADVLSVTYHPFVPFAPVRFASADALGLAADPLADNIDALELVACGPDMGCDRRTGCDPIQRGIRSKYADSDRDGDVDLRDYAVFTDCFPIPGQVTPTDDAACRFVFDVDRDGDLDLNDYAAFHCAITACTAPPC